MMFLRIIIPFALAAAATCIGGIASASAQPSTEGAQRAILYEEDPDNPRGRQFPGTALWRLESQPSTHAGAPDVEVRADVTVPNVMMAMRMTLRRNTDKVLHASHVIEIVFTLPPDFWAGAVSNVPGILMKESEQTRGVPLSGFAVKIATPYFLLGLSAADARRNLALLKVRQWFDIPIIYTNNRRAIMAVDKGDAGERALEDAFAAWGQ